MWEYEKDVCLKTKLITSTSYQTNLTQNGYHLLPSVVVSYKRVSNILTYFSLTHVLLRSAEDISCSFQFSPLFRVVFLFIFTSLLRYVFVNVSYVLLKNPSPIWRRPLFLFWSCTTTSSYSCLNSYQTSLGCFKEILNTFYDSRISEYWTRNFPFAKAHYCKRKRTFWPQSSPVPQSN